jgi:arylformamidase
MRIANGDSVNLSAITMSPHVGTHADAPLHVRDGGRPSDAIPTAPFIGIAHVVDVRDLTGAISLETLRARLVPAESPPRTDPVHALTRLLLRTGASVASARFPDAWPWLAPDAIAALVARGLVLLGTDAPSVDDRYSKTLVCHHACFDRGAWVLENVDLRDVAPGRYEMRGLPMAVQGIDAAPVRVLLRTL